MTTLNVRSSSQILGNMIREILINSDISAFKRGSDIAIVLEAISEQIAQTEVSALKILESINLESLVGTALDKKAQSVRLPDGEGGYGRKSAIQSSGPVTIGSSFNKISSKLYAGKAAPFAGSFTLHIENAEDFPASGSVYLGRGTVDRFEGPIPYSTAPVDNGSFWTITLDDPLTKSHLHSDLVTLSQGGDRTVPAGTKVYVPPNSEEPAVRFTTVRTIVIPDGEAEADVNVTCDVFGEVGNALAGSINTFTSTPFTGATVTNPTTFQNGQSTENDEDLRQRIKDYPSTLSRGTDTAILAAIRGATDPVTGRTIRSAVVLAPVEPGDFARVFIDDGTGLEPIFEGQAEESLLQNASGQETRLKTANFPITAAITEGSESAPFVLTNTMSVTVQVDDIVETYYVTPSNYQNISAATAYEVIRDLNSQSNIVGFRTLDNGTRIVMLDLSGKAETIQVTAGDLQEVLGLPIAELRPIFLYKDAVLLSFRGKTATIETRPINEWNLLSSDLQDIRVSVDGVIQTFTIADSDFDPYQATIQSANISQWAAVLSTKLAGVKFTVSGQILVWSTWQTFSPNGSIQILETKADGSPAGWVGDDKMWLTTASGGVLSDVGDEKDYNFNRFTGEAELLEKPEAGSSITIGSEDTRAHIRSVKTTTGLYTLTPQATTVGNSKLIFGFDGSHATREIDVASGDSIRATQPDAVNATNVIRLYATSPGVFLNAAVSDWLYIVQDVSSLTPLPANLEGFYRLTGVGFQKHGADEITLGLSGVGEVHTAITVATQAESAVVTITLNEHGLKTGDLIRVDHTSIPIGGIPQGDLSQVDVPITVLNSNEFTYVAGSAATYNQNWPLDQISFNRIKITHANHGFETGGLVNVSVIAPSTIGGLTPAELTVAGAEIDVIDSDNYYYRANRAVLNNTAGTITSVTYIADTWVEFEVSEPQSANWFPILGNTYTLTDRNLYLFRSTTTPQLVDFGSSVSTLTVDEVVEAINTSIFSGVSAKVTPQQLEIRSNKFDKTGTCAVLAVIGNAENVFATATASGIQSHIAFSESGDTHCGNPVVSSVVKKTDSSAGYPMRSFLFVDRNITNVIDENDNPTIESPATFHPTYPEGFQHVWVTGRSSGYGGRVYNNQLAAPYTGIMSGEEVINPVNTWDYKQNSALSLDRYAGLGIRLRDIPLNNFDSFTVVMDLDATDKTVAVPMYKIAKIQDIDNISGAGKGQVISFRLKDPEDSDLPFYDSTSVYSEFSFADFKMLTKSVGLYREDASDRVLIVRSAEYGGPSKLRFSIRFPTTPDVDSFSMTHTNDFVTDKSRTNVIVTLPSDALIAGSVLSSGPYKVTPTLVGTIYNWRISAGSLNAGSEYAAGNVLNIGGAVPVAGAYEILSAISLNSLSNTASVVSGSNVVTVVTAAPHGLADGDLVNTVATIPIGGISAFNLTRTATEITYINPNTFSYNAGAAATANESGAVLQSVSSGAVTVSAPGHAGISTSQNFDAAVAPVSSWPLLEITFNDLRDFMNLYLVDTPVVSAETIGTDLDATFITKPTYSLYPAATAYTGDDISGAFNHHSFETHFSGSASIFQYDPSTPLSNSIKATVQTDESIFPTITEATGTAYSPINEEVMIVPTNTKTVVRWLEFKASSSLNLLARIDRIDGDASMQLSSREAGSAGAVNVTGVTANKVESFIVGNASRVDDSIRAQILYADARSLVRGQMVIVENNIASPILRSYRDEPVGASLTTANTVDINNYFRETNSIKYIRKNANEGRIIFLRYGMHSSQTEPMVGDETVEITNVGSGLVRFKITAGSGSFSARVGDMMYIQPGSPFPLDVRCKPLPNSGVTDEEDPEYIGYPVVHVVDEQELLVIAPNITSFGSTAVGSTTDIVFIPAIWNEKNIKTNHREGNKFDELVNNNEAYFLIKTLGSGFVSVWLQNSPAEATDTMRLSEMYVSTDDYALFGDGFDPSNQGTYRIVAHNGRNHMIVYNPAGGKDELFDVNAVSNGGDGSRIWRVGPLDDGRDRQLRILDSDSVRIGDYLRISSASENTQWFNDTFIGSWEITGIGFQALDYSGDPLPHDAADGSNDQSFFAPYIDISMPNAPVAVTDSTGAYVDYFLIGNNVSSIGFTEGEFFSCIRMISGQAVNAQNTENSDIFLEPQLSSSKISATFGTKISAMNKLGFDESTFLGIDGYKYYSGLVRTAHRIIDGLPSNLVLYPGTKAAGAIVDVNTPLIKSISIDLQVRPKDGVTLNSISEVVKSAVAGYINGVGVGSPVVLSEIIRTVQSLPGVFSVKIISTTPAATEDRIVSSETEKPFVLSISEDITVG